MEFGQILRRLRESAGLTQAGLAAAAGLSIRTVQGWEQGRRSPVSADFFRLVKALGASPNDFASMAEEKPVKPAAKKKGKGK